MSRINVFLTVDTEHSMGGFFESALLKPVGNEKRVFGKIGDTFWGIPLIMDIAEAFGLRLTFFVEVFNKFYFGVNESKDVCEYILGRNHDIQLHLHPNYLNFTVSNPRQRIFNDLIGTYPLEKQAEMIHEGIETLLHMGVSRPIAFRAGGFGANEATLKALAANNVIIDSSYNRSFIGRSCLFKDRGINDINCIDDIWEFPITNFIESTGIRSQRYIAMDINGVGSDEMEWVLRASIEQGPRNIVIIMHSFSFIRPYDIQYIRARPRKHVIRRFERLCQFLSYSPDDFHVRTVGSIAKEELVYWAEKSAHRFHIVPARLSLLRGCQQLKDNLT